MTINLFRFFHLSEMGDLNYIFGYSIETNPDKAGMCKYECIWLDQVKNDIDINFFIWSSCSAALKLSILVLNHTSSQLVFCLSGSRGFENCFYSDYKPFEIRKK